MTLISLLGRQVRRRYNEENDLGQISRSSMVVLAIETEEPEMKMGSISVLDFEAGTMGVGYDSTWRQERKVRLGMAYGSQRT